MNNKIRPLGQSAILLGFIMVVSDLASGHEVTQVMEMK